MLKAYKILRGFFLTVIIVATVVVTGFYVLLSTPWAAERVRRIATEQLTQLLGTEVAIGTVRIEPFSKVFLGAVSVKDDFGKQALNASEIEARFEFWNFITSGSIDIDYVNLKNVKFCLYRKTSDSPLNIAAIISRLKTDDSSKPPTSFDLVLHTVKFENAEFQFDILDRPPTENRFDAAHIHLYDINLGATIPILSNSEIDATVQNLSFRDNSGFELRNLNLSVEYTPTQVTCDRMVIELPSSHLVFGPTVLKFDSSDDFNKVFAEIPIDINILPGSFISPSDFKIFMPALKRLDDPIGIDLNVSVSKNLIDLNRLVVKGTGRQAGIELNLSGSLLHYLNPQDLNFENIRLSSTVMPSAIASSLNEFQITLSPKMTEAFNRLDEVNAALKISGLLSDLDVTGVIKSNFVDFDINGQISYSPTGKDLKTNIDASFNHLDLGSVTGDSMFGNLSAQIAANALIENNKLKKLDAEIEQAAVEYNNHLATLGTTAFSMTEDGNFKGYLTGLFDDTGKIIVEIEGNSNSNSPRLGGQLNVKDLSLYDLGLINKYEDHKLFVDADFDLTGVKAQWIDGFINISNAAFISSDPTKPSLTLKKFEITANNTIRPNLIEIDSDWLTGRLEGNLSLWNLAEQSRNILAQVMPAVFESVSAKTENKDLRDNDFRFNLTIDNTEQLSDFFNLPITVIYPLTIDGHVDSPAAQMEVGIDAPYLMKGDMIIEDTSIQASLDGSHQTGLVFLTTQFPTKKGQMSLSGGLKAVNNIISTAINWEIEREKPINGNLTFETLIGRDSDTGKMTAQVDFLPCEINFGNDVWRFAPSTVIYKPKYLEFKNFALSTLTQSVKIDGKCIANDPFSCITVRLDKVVLNTIFETLDINKALIGGVATGTLFAGGIFDNQPFVTSDDLHVVNIGYNNCVLGDGDIKAKWDNERGSFFLDAVISQKDGNTSFIKGDIFPASESLDITFDAKHINVGFMRPFMDAFAEDVSGFASGHAHLFGTFKYIDMEGDVFAENLGLKVGFTNTWYYATDSIHIVPGLIDIKNVTVRDTENHKATLNGFVKHNFFKDPVFDFRITDAKDFLCYDVPLSLSPDWYGKVFGNGSAFITGSPGIVNIDVNMSTAEGSVFTFVLSDTEEAEQYNFITFRDKNRNVITDTILRKEVIPVQVLAYREKIRRQALEQNPPSTYNMNIQMDINPAAKIIIVMDPVGGDEIKSWGRGNLRMTYTSIGSELRMYGTYAIDRGSYNFTLQDIIVKDFNIKEGSSITFTGDPYNAMLDITASYLVNANLSDLDESFINDPELNRTNVPVHALLLVKGDMRQPDISFDLEFPTLTSDVYRKVRSIISTDEMMDRQMIYLLALNRFYTPEYMTATKGNELFSVASSTISSRLSSMLGKLSENWTISPNLRSDKGDFSDVQFDVALSSNLLNNRLRMNGNFGYRDKSLNTTQFIGDFDLEYLLNRSGSWRLKAYNRFNDQTYFLRTAKTTQGVGIKFQREFDNWFSFLRKRRKTENDGSPTITEVGEEKISVDGQLPTDSAGVGNYPLTN